MLLHVATTYKSTENQTSQAQSQDLKAGDHLYYSLGIDVYL